MYTPFAKWGQRGLKAETVLAEESKPPNPPLQRGDWYNHFYGMG